MKKIKILSLVLAVLMAATMLGACAATGENDAAEKVLTMGTNAAFPPYEFMDENNNVAGIDAEIAAAVAEKLGMKLEIKDMAFDSLITAVSSGSVDMVLAGMTVTEECKEAVNFSDS